jgi:hypothetical protein
MQALNSTSANPPQHRCGSIFLPLLLLPPLLMLLPPLLMLLVLLAVHQCQRQEQGGEGGA